MSLARSLRVLCVPALAAAPAIGAATLVSNFDSGDEGWTVGSSQGAAGVTGFAWDASCRHPDGAIAATDMGDQGGWWFVAPGTWAGDWTTYLGGTIGFDVFAMGGQDTTLNPPFEAVVFLLADGGRLRAKDAAGASSATGRRPRSRSPRTGSTSRAAATRRSARRWRASPAS